MNSSGAGALLEHRQQRLAVEVRLAWAPARFDHGRRDVLNETGAATARPPGQFA